MAKYDLESRIRETEGQADALCTANEQLQQVQVPPHQDADFVANVKQHLLHMLYVAVQEIGDTTAQIGELQQELRRLNILR